MGRYLMKRAAHSVVVLLLVTFIVFILLKVLPGGTARAILGPRASPAAIASFNRANGLDKPILVQYTSYLWRLLHGNLGYSYHYNASVSTLLTQLLPKTLILAGLGTLGALILAIPIGLIQASRRNRPSDHIATGLEFVFYGMPTFWLGLVLILYFAIQHHIFPAEAPQGASVGAILSDPRALVLPVLTVMLVTLAFFTRYMRAAAVGVMAQDFIVTARAKGMSLIHLFRRHITRNSMIPMATLVGLSLPVIVGGETVTETVFNYPGMGFAFWTAAQERDYSVLLGFTLVTGAATVVGSLLADLAYGWLDPRVRVK